MSCCPIFVAAMTLSFVLRSPGDCSCSSTLMWKNMDSGPPVAPVLPPWRDHWRSGARFGWQRHCRDPTSLRARRRVEQHRPQLRTQLLDKLDLWSSASVMALNCAQHFNAISAAPRRTVSAGLTAAGLSGSQGVFADRSSIRPPTAQRLLEKRAAPLAGGARPTFGQSSVQ